MNHPKIDTLYEYVDLVLSDATRFAIEEHLAMCPQCRLRVEGMRRMDAALRRIPREEISPDFTSRVVKKLGPHESESVSWKILKSLAPVAALTIVMIVVYGVLNLTGAFDATGSLGQQDNAAHVALRGVGDGFWKGVAVMTGWLRDLLPFLFSQNVTSGGLALYVAVIFGIVGVLDKYLFMPMVRKRRMESARG